MMTITTPLEEGKPVPDFSIQIDETTSVSLADYQGQPFVLYFYPKDNTPGCTTEAKDFSLLKEKFEDLGVKILGVSPDSPAKHVRFTEKQKLSIQLGSDEDHTVASLFGAWGEKKMYGKTFLGIIRSTFLIDADGKLARKWMKVRVKGHAEDVLNAAKELVEQE